MRKALFAHISCRFMYLHRTFRTKAAIDEPNWPRRTIIIKPEYNFTIHDVSLQAPQQANNQGCHESYLNSLDHNNPASFLLPMYSSSDFNYTSFISFVHTLVKINCLNENQSEARSFDGMSYPSYKYAYTITAQQLCKPS